MPYTSGLQTFEFQVYRNDEFKFELLNGESKLASQFKSVILPLPFHECALPSAHDSPTGEDECGSSTPEIPHYFNRRQIHNTVNTLQ